MTKQDSAEPSNSGNVELREPDNSHNEPLRVQQQLLDDETRALQVNRIFFLLSLYWTFLLFSYSHWHNRETYIIQPFKSPFRMCITCKIFFTRRKFSTCLAIVEINPSLAPISSPIFSITLLLWLFVDFHQKSFAWFLFIAGGIDWSSRRSSRDWNKDGGNVCSKSLVINTCFATSSANWALIWSGYMSRCSPICPLLFGD